MRSGSAVERVVSCPVASRRTTRGGSRLWAALAILGVGASGASARDGATLSYEQALRAYANGQREAAVQALGAITWEEMDKAWLGFVLEVGRAGRCRTCPDTLANEPIRAAAMLHVDRDLLENPPHQDVEQPPACAGRHASRAVGFAELLALREGTRDFARRFYIAVTWRAEWDACLDQAVAWARAGLAAFPDDPDLWLALGVTHEKRARLTQEQPQRALRDAQQALTRAVSADPARLAPRVHLGRVQWRLGLLEDARRTLEAALTPRGLGAEELRSRRSPHGTGAGFTPATEPDNALYLAHVFLGQVHERAGRAADAVEAFRRALAVAPGGSVAALGLAHALLRQGDTAGAALAAEQALAAEAGSLDPYRHYNADNASGAPRLFEALREAARQ